MRAIGLDVHRDFCEVAVVEDGVVGSAGRVASTPAALEVLAASLVATDKVALEVTGNAWEIARILEPHVAKVLVVSPADTGIAGARAKTDRLDARTLAKLLWAGELDAVWTPDERCRVMRRRLSRREQLVRSRSRAKNEVHAVLVRRLVGKPPMSDLFGVKGREWLRGLELPIEECETVEGCMRHVRVPRRGDRRRRTPNREGGAVLAGDQAADDRAGCECDRRGRVHGRDRRHPPVSQLAPTGGLSRP